MKNNTEKQVVFRTKISLIKTTDALSARQELRHRGHYYF